MKKKLFFSIAVSLFLLSCNTSQKEQEAEVETIKAEFFYMDNAAVLKGNNFIYGVVIDDMALKLAQKIAPIKNDEFDMVPVVVKGVVAPKPENEEGWDHRVTIKEIIEISSKPSQSDLKIE